MAERAEMRPRRILFLAWRDLANPLAGGSEVLIDRLAGGLAERGHDVSLLCAGPTAPRSYAVYDNGGRYTQYLRAPGAYLRRFRNSDLVVDVANGLSFFVPLFRRKSTICLVNHLHTDQWEQWFSPPLATLGRALERDAMPWAYRRRLFIAVSASTASDLRGIGVSREHIRIVPNGIDLPPEDACAEGKAAEPLFVCLGRLVPHKRIALVLEAWKQVRPRLGGQLVIAGDGPQRADLERMAGEGVIFAGHISENDKQRLLGRAWLLLHPAMVEGWGLVVLEAAAVRTPTVGFDVPGLRDSVVHGQTGLLATSKEDFIEAWCSLTQDTALRTRMGTSARSRAARFGWSRSIDCFLAVAEEAIEETKVERRTAPVGPDR